MSGESKVSARKAPLILPLLCLLVALGPRLAFARTGAVASLWPVGIDVSDGAFSLIDYALTDDGVAPPPADPTDRFDIIRDIRYFNLMPALAIDPEIFVIGTGHAGASLMGYDASGPTESFAVNFDGSEYTQLAVDDDGAFISGKTYGMPCPGHLDATGALKFPTDINAHVYFDGFIHRVDEMTTSPTTFDANSVDHYCYGLRSNDYDEVVTVTLSDDGNYVWLGGSTDGTPDGVDPAQGNRGPSIPDSVVVRLAKNLDSLTALTLQFGSGPFDEILGAATDGRGGLFVSGMTQGNLCARVKNESTVGILELLHINVVCDQGNSGQGSGTIARDAYVAHIVVGDTGGGPELQIDWIYQFGTNREDSAKGIVFVDGATPRLYLSGRTEGDFIAGAEVNRQNNDGWLIRIDLDANLLPDINDVVTKEIAQWGGELGDSHTKMRVRTFADRTYLYQAGGQDNDLDHSEGSCFDTDSAALQADPAYDDPGDNVDTIQPPTFSSIQVLVWDITTTDEVATTRYFLDGNRGDVEFGFDLTPEGNLLVSGQTTSSDLGGTLSLANSAECASNGWSKTGFWFNYETVAAVPSLGTGPSTLLPFVLLAAAGLQRVALRPGARNHGFAFGSVRSSSDDEKTSSST